MQSVRVFIKIISILDEESFSETTVGCIVSYSVNNMMFPSVLYPFSFEGVHCFICGRGRLAVARYRMICLVLILIPDEELFSETAVGCTASYFVKII